MKVSVYFRSNYPSFSVARFYKNPSMANVVYVCLLTDPEVENVITKTNCVTEMAVLPTNLSFKSIKGGINMSLTDNTPRQNRITVVGLQPRLSTASLIGYFSIVNPDTMFTKQTHLLTMVRGQSFAHVIKHPNGFQVMAGVKIQITQVSKEYLIPKTKNRMMQNFIKNLSNQSKLEKLSR